VSDTHATATATIAAAAITEARTERLVLKLVADKQQRPWSLHEITHALRDLATPLSIEDALTQLQLHGLINRAEEIIFASQATAHIDRLELIGI
jgi:hypothetical protein